MSYLSQEVVPISWCVFHTFSPWDRDLMVYVWHICGSWYIDMLVLDIGYVEICNWYHKGGHEKIFNPIFQRFPYRFFFKFPYSVLTPYTLWKFLTQFSNVFPIGNFHTKKPQLSVTQVVVFSSDLCCGYILGYITNFPVFTAWSKFLIFSAISCMA